MNGTSEADQKPLYCHWDTHVDDVLFNNEADLDRHIYGHFMQSTEEPTYLAPTPASPQPRQPEVPLSSGQTIECHWDACHELFEIDQIMQHLRDSHMQGSLHPHLHECQSTAQGCTLPSPKSEDSAAEKQAERAAFVRLNSSTDSLSGTPSICACTCGSHSGSSDGCGGTSECCSHQSMPRIDPGSLPQLPSSASAACAPAAGSDPDSGVYRCMWCSHNGGECCGETFMTSPELHAHIAHCHVMEKPASMCSCSWKGCPRDGRPFGQRQKLIRHLQTHAKTYEFKCRICGRPLSCESMRRMHERSHSSEKPFKCNMCGRRFRANSGLIVHQRTHTGEKPLVCKFPGCDKRFAESSNLAKHMRTHQEKSFECPLCHRKFTRRDHLLRHQKTRCRQPPQDPAPHPGFMGLQSQESNHAPAVAPVSVQMPPQMPPPVQPAFMYTMDGPRSRN